MTSLELSEDEVQVWVGSLTVSDAQYTDFAKTLCTEEADRAKALSPEVARRFTVARGMLRRLLWGFTGVAPAKLRFDYSSNGKPSLAGHDIHFNISHSADLGVFAFAPDRAVGVDLESERPVRRMLDVAQRFLSEEEISSLAATAPDKRNSVFLKAWVVREARLKAQGKGVWAAFQADATPGNITHRVFTPRPGYIAAVAAPGSDWRLYTCTVAANGQPAPNVRG